MSELSSEHHQQIAEVLQRPLTPEELAPAVNLAALSPQARAVADILVSKQLVLCALYLRALTTASLSETKQFMDELTSSHSETSS